MTSPGAWSMPARHGGRLPEVSPEEDHLECSVGPGYSGFGEAVPAAVVDEDDLVLVAARQRTGNLLVQAGRLSCSSSRGTTTETCGCFLSFVVFVISSFYRLDRRNVVCRAHHLLRIDIGVHGTPYAAFRKSLSYRKKRLSATCGRIGSSRELSAGKRPQVS